MYKSLLALSGLCLASSAYAARDSKMCVPEPPATCYPADCKPCYCLGPNNFLVNAPVSPRTCNGDFLISVAGFYWNAHQDGMEYAIDNEVQNPGPAPGTPFIQQLNNLIDAKFENPHFEWNFGFKVGIGYVTTCDSWDIGVTWTWYRGFADSHIEAEPDDNHTLLPLWSAFAPAQGSVLYATDIQTQWRLQLNLIDIELGRDFWTSKYLSFRPHIGLRIAFIEQDYDLQHKGGSWNANGETLQVFALNNEVELDNDFKGVGLRSGFDTTWNIGCGFGIYGNFAFSVVYGKFSIEHDEDNRLAVAPHTKTHIVDTETHFRASRGIFDLGLGIQWIGMLCKCKYALTAMLGWENHIFLHQNQLWRIIRIGDEFQDILGQFPNNTGENVYDPRRGNLDTQGWTLRLRFAF